MSWILVADASQIYFECMQSLHTVYSTDMVDAVVERVKIYYTNLRTCRCPLSTLHTMHDIIVIIIGIITANVATHTNEKRVESEENGEQGRERERAANATTRGRAHTIIYICGRESLKRMND